MKIEATTKPILDTLSALPLGSTVAYGCYYWIVVGRSEATKQLARLCDGYIFDPPADAILQPIKLKVVNDD